MAFTAFSPSLPQIGTAPTPNSTSTSSFVPFSSSLPITPKVIAPTPQTPITDGGTASLPFIKQLTEMGIGVGSQIAKVGLGVGQTFLKGGNVIGNTLGTGQNQYNPLIKSIEDIKNKIYTEPFQQELSTPSGNIGKFIGATAPFVATGGATTALQGASSGLTEGLTNDLAQSGLAKRVLGYFIDKSAQVLPEVATSAATQYVASGGDTESAKKVGLAAGVISALTHVGSDVFTQMIPQTVKENVGSVFGGNGKMSLKDASVGQKTDNAIGALATINNLAPEIKVIDSAGIEKPFDPSKVTMTELPQALYQAKNKIYDAYTTLAKQSGENGASFGQADFNQVISDLNKYSGAGYTPSYSNKAGQIIDALHRFGTVNPADGSVYFKNTDPALIQKLIESINKDVNPLSDSAGAVVASDASTAIRKIMDDKINQATTGTSGAGYQSLRNAYGQLLSIEPDVINMYKKALKGSTSGSGFASNFVDGIATVDALQGLLTGSPTETLRGGLIEAVKKGVQYLRSPEVKIQRAFNLMRGDSVEPVSNLSARLGVGNPENNPSFMAGKQAGQAITKLPNKSGSFVNAGEIKNFVNK